MKVMFNKKLLIYFSRTHLFIYHKDLSLPLRMELEEKAIQNLEKIDRDWIKDKLKQTLGKNNLKNSRAIVVLSKDIVFDRLLNGDSIQDKEKETEEFLNEIPLEKNLVQYKEFIKDSNTLIAAVNKNLYLELIQLLLEYGIEVKWIIPEIVFNRIDFNKTFLGDLLKQKELLTYGNFMEDDGSKKKINIKTAGMIVGIILLTGTILGVTTYFVNNRVSKKEKHVTESVQETQTPEETQTTVQEEKKLINKDEISITIYNGTGTPGFAGQIEGAINPAGYKNTDAANADSFDYTNTVIETSPDVSDEVISELRDVLKNYLKSFEIRKTLSGTNVVHVTTGEALTAQ